MNPPVLPLLIAGLIGGYTYLEPSPHQPKKPIVQERERPTSPRDHHQAALYSLIDSEPRQDHRLPIVPRIRSNSTLQNDLILPPQALLRALIKTESGGNPKATRLEPRLAKRYPAALATSYGQMQVLGLHTLPGEACDDMTISDLLHPDKNVLCGTRILSRHLSHFEDTEKALIAYNGGTGCFQNQTCLSQAKKYAKRVMGSIIN